MKAIKVIFVALLWLVGIGLVLLAGYAAWRVTRRHWAALLFCLFMGLNVIVAAAALVARKNAQRAGGREGLLVFSTDLIAQTRLARLRLAIERVLGILTVATGSWLGGFSRTLSMRRSGSNESAIQLGVRSNFEGIAADIPPMGLLLVGIAYLVEYLAPAQTHWVKVFLCVLAVQTILRQITYAVGLTSLPTQLRRTPRQPYLAFLVVAIADLFSFILILNAIINWGQGGVFSVAALRTVFTHFYFSDLASVVKGIWHGNEPPLRDILVTGTGVLYNSTLLTSLLQFGDFIRKDEDYLYLASGYCTVGRYTEALHALDKIKSPTARSYTLRASAYIGVSRLDKATEECKQVLSLRRVEATPEHLFNILLASALWLPLGPGAYVELIKRGIEVGSDVELANALNIFVQSGLAPPVALSLFADPGVAQKMPLSYSILLIADKQVSEAQSWLAGIQPTNLPAKILRSYLVLIAATQANPDTKAEQDKDYFDSWSSKSLTEISDAVSNQSLQGLELLSIFAPILAIQLFAKRLHSHYEQPWLFLLEETKKRISTDKVAQEELGVLTGLERKARAQTA